jgi:hypothetical protein
MNLSDLPSLALPMPAKNHLSHIFQGEGNDLAFHIPPRDKSRGMKNTGWINPGA